MNGLGASLHVTGTLTATEDVHLDGRVTGTIQLKDATLTIGEQAVVEADIHGAGVVVRGTVKGSIVASERIELTATARVTGSLSALHVVLADGAVFNGAIDMGQRTIAARLAAYHDRKQG